MFLQTDDSLLALVTSRGVQRNSKSVFLSRADARILKLMAVPTSTCFADDIQSVSRDLKFSPMFYRKSGGSAMTVA
jgi:hypothetical protein